MKLSVSLFIFIMAFTLNQVKAQDNCADIVNADGTWMITYGGTKKAIKSKCNLNENKMCDSIFHMSPMPAISCAIQSGQYSAMTAMLDAKVDINARDNGGLTPLMHTAWASESHGSFSEALIRSGADLDAKDNLNRSAVYYAHLLQNTKVEAKIIKENFDKKNPCDFSYQNLSEYYFIAKSETRNFLFNDSEGNYVEGVKQVSKAFISGISLGATQKYWKSFIEKATPYTSESYYQSNCVVAKNKSSGSSSKARGAK